MHQHDGPSITSDCAQPGKNYTIENCHWGDCTASDDSSCPTQEWCPFNVSPGPVYTAVCTVAPDRCQFGGAPCGSFSRCPVLRGRASCRVLTAAAAAQWYRSSGDINSGSESWMRNLQVTTRSSSPDITPMSGWQHTGGCPLSRSVGRASRSGSRVGS